MCKLEQNIQNECNGVSHIFIPNKKTVADNVHEYVSLYSKSREINYFSNVQCFAGHLGSVSQRLRRNV